MPGYAFRPFRGGADGVADSAAVAAVRLGCAVHDGVDPRSVVDGVPTADEVAESSTRPADWILVTYGGPGAGGGEVVGCVTVRWWREGDGTWLYLHRGHLLPAHRGRGVGSAMLAWAEARVRRIAEEHGTTRTAVIGANAAASERDATALLLGAGYRPAFTLLEMELPDLGISDRLPERGLPAGVRIGPVGPAHQREAWRTVVDSYAGAPHTPEWTYDDFAATATATATACRRAAWDGDRMAGVVLCSLNRRDRSVGEVEELSVGARWRRMGIGRALLLDGLRSLREQGAQTARLYTGAGNPHRSYDLYESVGFRRRTEHVRYRRPLLS
ncbi:GNAT family N-acetyltransferase [Streptomyces radiopugnans]|uniref:GNAT family N-acetyltransferase n=1 Tax=Streptomyces radiopugnans TaxID=403935 RepID=UPI003F1BB8D5